MELKISLPYTQSKTLYAIVIICFFGTCNRMIPKKSYDRLVNQADSLYNHKAFNTSLQFYNEAIRLRKDQDYVLYNAACSAALAGEIPRSFELLNLSIDSGWSNFRHLRTDNDLNPLHGTEFWEKIIKRIEFIESKYDRSLQIKLLEILDDDQKARNEYLNSIKVYGNNSENVKSAAKIVLSKDSINLIKIKNIISEYGWVSPEKVGQEASSCIFLVIQHSDIKTQEEYLPLLKDAVKSKYAKASYLALLEDRIAIRKNKKQIYGSQVGKDEKTGKHYVYPIEKPFQVDKRRSKVGLGPLSDYLKNWDIIWDAHEHSQEKL